MLNSEKKRTLFHFKFSQRASFIHHLICDVRAQMTNFCQKYRSTQTKKKKTKEKTIEIENSLIPIAIRFVYEHLDLYGASRNVYGIAINSKTKYASEFETSTPVAKLYKKLKEGITITNTVLVMLKKVSLHWVTGRAAESDAV